MRQLLRIALFLSLTLDVEIYGQQKLVPLRADNTRIDIAGNIVSFDLTNTADKPIDAYDLMLQWRLSNGQVVTTGQTNDFYRSLNQIASSSYPPEFLLPQKSSRLQFPLPHIKLSTVTVSGVEVVVRAAVFGDDTAAGETQVIDRIFRVRRAEASEFAYWRSILNAALSAASPKDALRQLPNEFGKRVFPANEPIEERHARQELKQYIQDLVDQSNKRIAAGRDDKVVAQQLRDIIAQQASLASSHSIQRAAK